MPWPLYPGKEPRCPWVGRMLDTSLLLYKELQADAPAVNTLRLGYKDQHVNAVYGDNSYVRLVRNA
jgi:hypothetical protein